MPKQTVPVAALLLCLLPLLANGPLPPACAAPEEGAPAPMLVLTPLEGRKKVLLTDLLAKGRPVVLAFGSFT